MPAKTSKEVTDRQKSGLYLITALLMQGLQVAERLLELVRPHLREGDQEPNFFASFVALARHLEASLARLVASDERLYAANAHLDRLRALRDELFSLLARKVARIRLTLVNQYVAPQLFILGLEQETARSPMPLLRQSDRIQVAFQGAGLEKLLGEAIFAQPVDLRSQVAELSPIADDLRLTLRQVDEAQREADQAKVAKDRDMKSHDVLYLRNARSFEDNCRMIGDDELADRVRPAERRPGRPKTEPAGEAEGPSTEEEPAAAPPTEEEPAVAPPAEVPPTEGASPAAAAE